MSTPNSPRFRSTKDEEKLKANWMSPTLNKTLRSGNGSFSSRGLLDGNESSSTLSTHLSSSARRLSSVEGDSPPILPRGDKPPVSRDKHTISLRSSNEGSPLLSPRMLSPIIRHKDTFVGGHRNTIVSDLPPALIEIPVGEDHDKKSMENVEKVEKSVKVEANDLPQENESSIIPFEAVTPTESTSSPQLLDKKDFTSNLSPELDDHHSDVESTCGIMHDSKGSFPLLDTDEESHSPLVSEVGSVPELEEESSDEEEMKAEGQPRRTSIHNLMKRSVTDEDDDENVVLKGSSSRRCHNETYADRESSISQGKALIGDFAAEKRLRRGTGVYHSYSKRELIGIIHYVNEILEEDESMKKKIPIEIDEGQLMKLLQNGVALCKLVLAVDPTALDPLKIHTGLDLKPMFCFENIGLGLMGATIIDCQIVNIDPSDVYTGSVHLVLGLLAQIVRRYLARCVVQTVPQMCKDLSSPTCTSMRFENSRKVLLEWCNDILEKYNSMRTIKSLDDDLKDGVVYAYILHDMDPTACSLDALEIKNSMLRIEKVLDYAATLGCHFFVTPKDILVGISDKNFAFLATLFKKWHEIPKETIIKEETVEEFTSMEEPEETSENHDPLRKLVEEQQAALRAKVSHSIGKYRIENQRLMEENSTLKEEMEELKMRLELHRLCGGMVANTSDLLGLKRNLGKVKKIHTSDDQNDLSRALEKIDELEALLAGEHLAREELMSLRAKDRQSHEEHILRLRREEEEVLQRVLVYRKRLIKSRALNKRYEEHFHALESKLGNDLLPIIYQSLSSDRWKQARKIGYLYKQDAHGKGWKQRLFILQDNFLLYYRKVHDEEPIGTVMLNGCVVEEHLEDVEGRSCCFIVKGTENRCITLSAERHVEMEVWIEAIRGARPWYSRNPLLFHDAEHPQAAPFVVGPDASTEIDTKSNGSRRVKVEKQAHIDAIPWMTVESTRTFSISSGTHSPSSVNVSFQGISTSKP